MFKNKLIFLFCFLLSLTVKAETYTINGYIYDANNGESLIGAAVFVKGTTNGTVTNAYGFYSFSLPAGKYSICYSYIGYQEVVEEIELNKNISINHKLETKNINIKEVIICESNQSNEDVQSTKTGVIKIPVINLKSIPTIGGEADVIKIMQLMPGVKKGSDGQNGFQVRGGTADQNLVLLDEATIYNPSHLFVFFSVFNNDALKDVSMIKGGFPANYGGRLSSVMDVRMKEGDMLKYHCEGGIGVLSSRLSLEGPIIKDKMSYIVSGRRCYIDQVLKIVNKEIPYYFYDFNAKLNYKINQNNRIYFSTYYGDDVLKSKESVKNPLDFNISGSFNLINYTNCLRWNHVYNPKLFSNLSLINSNFKYGIKANIGDYNISIGSKINDYGLKWDFDYYKNSKNKIYYGLLYTYHNFTPNVVSAQNSAMETIPTMKSPVLNSEEFAIYTGSDKTIDSSFKISYGIRFSGTLTDNKIYFNPEPRIVLNYSLNETSSIKFGYSRMMQYMHQVSSSSVALPTDLWYPVTKNIKPQKADQISLSYSKDIKKAKSIVTVEAYYKWLYDLIEYKEGTVLILNNNFEQSLINGTGKTYGTEIFINKTVGKLTGWIGYTLSWSKRYFDELNKGKEYFDRYDRRHDFSIVGSYDINKHISFSAVWVYSTGSRFTSLNGFYLMPSPSMTVGLGNVYSDKNAIILPPSHRLDINIIIKHKAFKKLEGELQIGAYNVYNRAQPYRITVVNNPDGTIKYQAVGLFGFTPSIAYNFKF